MPPSSADRRAVRADAARRRARRGAGISLLSTVVVLGILAALILTSSGWPQVRDTFFDPDAFVDAFPDVLGGFWLDVRLFLIVEVVVLVLGLLVALGRTARSPALFPVRLLCTGYVDLLRGIPTILVVYLIGFGVPALVSGGPNGESGPLGWLPTDPVVLGGIGLALAYGAYVAEVFRAGIEAVPPTQRTAALAVGLSERQALRHVVLPQAVRRVVPPLLNDFISLQKDVALVSVLGPLEAFRQAQIYAAANFNYTPLLAAAALYLVVTVPLARILDRVQARERIALGAVR